MGMTFAQQAQNNRLYISLRDLGIDEKTVYGLTGSKYDYKLLVQLVVFTPTKQSHLGEKFDSYKKLNNKSLNQFLLSVFSKAGIKNTYLFSSYKDKTKKRTDLTKKVLNDKEAMICLRCDNGVRDSLYMAIRNSIAHGNVIETDEYVILYAVSDDKKEYDSPISFFLRIKGLRRLQSFLNVLEGYK